MVAPTLVWSSFLQQLRNSVKDSSFPSHKLTFEIILVLDKEVKVNFVLVLTPTTLCNFLFVYLESKFFHLMNLKLV